MVARLVYRFTDTQQELTRVQQVGLHDCLVVDASEDEMLILWTERPRRYVVVTIETDDPPLTPVH